MKQRRARNNERHFLQLVNGQDRSAGDHDAGHPLAQQPGMGRALAGRPGAGMRVIGDSAHGQHAAHPQAHRGRRAVVDRDLTRAIRCRQPPGEHLGDIEKLAPIKGRDGRGNPRGPGAMAQRLQVQDNERCDLADASEPGERAEIPGRAGEVWRDEHVRGLGGGQETRVGALCPRRPRGGGQHSTPGHAHQHRQRRPTPPPGTQLAGGEIDDCPHPITRRAGPRPRRLPWVRG